MHTGIYKLTFNGTDKVYIGQQIDVWQRLRGHLHALRNNEAPPKLQEAFNKYGEPKLHVLEYCTKEALDDTERRYIDQYNQVLNGFNTTAGGQIGAGCGLPGELNGRSIYQDSKVLEVFEQLCTSLDSFIQIANKHSVSKEMVGHIAQGGTHTWIKEKYPDKFNAMLLFRKQKPNNTSPIIKASNGRKRQITFKNLITNEVIRTNSVHGYFKTNDVVNYNSFRLFVQQAKPGDTYKEHIQIIDIE